MSGALPAYIEPVRLAELGRTLEGRLPLARMRRLADLLADRGGEAAVRLEFRQEGRGRSTVRGWVRAGLLLTCQRCLEPFELTLDLPVRLAVVHSDVEAERLAEEEDPLLVDGDQALSLADVVEDELLLALPQVPAHPPPGCRVLVEAEASAGSPPSPFAALAGLEAPGPAARERKP
ncbi:MAG: YceD family protein [Gammaproteobacteria bacterium]|jgi:uncharacterized protein|nr:YceD family protein [Gammaproteobacteria bacterium]